MEYIIIGLGLCLIATYFIISKVIKIKVYNDKIEKANKQLEEEHNELVKIYNLLLEKRNELKENVAILSEQADQSAKAFYEKSLEKAKLELEYNLEKAAKFYQQEEENYKNTYLQVMAEIGEEFSEKNKNLIELNSQLEQLAESVAAAVESAKRQQELENSTSFYCLNLTQEDLNEIKRLKEIIPYLRNSEPLNKVIWKVYYEKPYTDLIGRVFGNKKPTGIYKITNIENKMCYVGQAVSIPDRWKQHIKRGLGAEPATRNKLYPAMKEFGVENFAFEMIEECSKEKLDEREDFWQDYFKAKEFGYSIK